ncbi:MAG: ferrochelatase, partial [Gammaproteobacteria bacterium]|nr:ferrochelatase [Gammaproteobacteria bacterium]
MKKPIINTPVKSFSHRESLATGILLVNLGTPDAPTTSAVRRYLKQFLSDPRVIEVPKAIWWFILNGIILPFRSGRSAKAYKKIWDSKRGSPLLYYSRSLVDRLNDMFKQDSTLVELGMCYGQPSVTSALEKFKAHNIDRLLILPLYPQYSGTTSGSVWDHVSNVVQQWRWVPEIRFINHYHDDEDYIDAWAAHISRSMRENPGERLLFSFHGIPKDYFEHGDPYFCHCQKTARLIAERLQLKDDQWYVSFQSRLGRKPWLQPYTDHVLTEWAKQGMKTVNVVCPGFAVDCLETLEEVKMEYGDLFVEHGGEALHYIPTLNDHVSHVKALANV